MKRNLLYSAFFITLLLIGCGPGNKDRTTTGARDAGESQISDAPGESGGGFKEGYREGYRGGAQNSRIYTVSDSSNTAIGTVQIGNRTKVTIADFITLDKTCDRPDKCKYKSIEMQRVYEIKYKDDGFKLRKGNGELILKVKVRPDRIKIARNEEMEEAWEIDISEGGADILFVDQEIGSVDFGSQSLPVLVKGGGKEYFVSGESKEPGAGILAIGDIPIIQQMILFSELISFDR